MAKQWLVPFEGSSGDMLPGWRILKEKKYEKYWSRLCVIHRRSFVVGRRLCSVGRRSSVVGHHSLVVQRRLSVVSRRSCILGCQSSVVRRPSSVFFNLTKIRVEHKLSNMSVLTSVLNSFNGKMNQDHEYFQWSTI